MKLGSVILAKIQQSDGRLKPRPVVVLQVMPPFQDLLVVALSSQLQHEVRGFDDVISSSSSDFRTARLKKDSLVRLGLLSTIPRNDYVGHLGNISQERLERLQTRLSEYISSGK